MTINSTHFCQVIAQDIMTTPVLTAYDTWSVKMLLDFFAQHHITGVPVINYQGELKGVVTMSDILRFENLPAIEKERLIGVSCYGEYSNYQLSHHDLEQLVLHADINCPVSQIMTPKIITVSQSTSILEVAKLFLEKRIHRVFVEQNQKLAGVISTSNLLTAMIKSCDC